MTTHAPKQGNQHARPAALIGRAATRRAHAEMMASVSPPIFSVTGRYTPAAFIYWCAAPTSLRLTAVHAAAATKIRGALQRARDLRLTDPRQSTRELIIARGELRYCAVLRSARSATGHRAAVPPLTDGDDPHVGDLNRQTSAIQEL